jgi:nucleotide-binding universal stress UspA family protein
VVRVADDAAMAAQPKRIVVGFDGSEGARRALDAAVGLMGYGSTMVVVSVTPESEVPRADRLDAARELLLAQLVTARYEPRVGDPADEIVRVASDVAADVIVVGRRGPDERDGADTGSVSGEVVRAASCDVLVVG